MSFFEELKRRNVIRVGIAYLIVAWLVLQFADVVLNNIQAPGWVFQVIMLVLGIGFPVVLIFAWAFEMTPEGIKKEKDVDRSQSITGQTSHKLDRSIIVVLVLALAYFAYARFASEKGSESISQQAAGQTENTGEETTPAPSAQNLTLAPDEPSIAVLPFVNMSSDPEQEYFSDGIAEEILNVLVRVKGLKVASRTSSFTYKGENLDIPEIARELKVNNILEGSVRKAGNRVRITAQLIDTHSDRHLWSNTFDRELIDIFAIQDEIARAIVDALKKELNIGLEAVAVESATDNLDAYELYLKARGLFITRDRLELSISLFEQAVALDPKFARAWEGLGAVYSVAKSWGIDDRDYSTLALEISRKALDLNPDLSTPWAVIGARTIDIENDFIKGMDYLDRAIAGDSKNTTAYLWRSIGWATLGFFQKAIDDVTTCLELDPSYENCRRHLARWQQLVGNTTLALELFQQGAERGFNGSYAVFAYELVQAGNRLAVAGRLFADVDGDRSYPVKELLDTLEFPQKDHSQTLSKLLKWIEKNGQSTDQHSDFLTFLGGFEYAVSREFANAWIWLEQYKAFRQSPYFKPMIRDIGLPKYWRAKGFPPICRAVGEDDFECNP